MWERLKDSSTMGDFLNSNVSICNKRIKDSIINLKAYRSMIHPKYRCPLSTMLDLQVTHLSLSIENYLKDKVQTLKMLLTMSHSNLEVEKRILVYKVRTARILHWWLQIQGIALILFLAEQLKRISKATIHYQRVRTKTENLRVRFTNQKFQKHKIRWCISFINN